MMDSLQLATRLAQVLDKKKATEVKVLKVRDLTVLTDYFVIASGSSSTQVKALAEEAEFQLEQQGAKPLRTEGYELDPAGLRHGDRACVLPRGPGFL